VANEIRIDPLPSNAECVHGGSTGEARYHSFDKVPQQTHYLLQFAQFAGYTKSGARFATGT
jgi:hypothetical protein